MRLGVTCPSPFLRLRAEETEVSTQVEEAIAKRSALYVR